MKQHITKEQWDELNDEQKIKFNQSIKELKLYDTGDIVPGIHLESIEQHLENVGYPTIGQMIEFLEGGNEILLEDIIGEWHLEYMQQHFRDNELCDVLWEGVKYKLKNHL